MKRLPSNRQNLYFFIVKPIKNIKYSSKNKCISMPMLFVLSLVTY